MTESEWFTCTQPQQMLHEFFTRMSWRKLRLFALGCWAQFSSYTRARPITVQNAYDCLERGRNDDLPRGMHTSNVRELLHFAVETGMPADLPAKAALLRDIVGNPFRATPLQLDWLSWQDCTVIKLADMTYERGVFDPLQVGVLADALEEAGCADAFLRDLRCPIGHARGCWVVDRILGKR